MQTYYVRKTGETFFVGFDVPNEYGGTTFTLPRGDNYSYTTQRGAEKQAAKLNQKEKDYWAECAKYA